MTDLRRLVIPAALCAALIAPRATAAQGACTGGDRYHVRSQPASIAYGPVTLMDLDNGEILAGTVQLRVIPHGRANRDWSLCVRGPSPVFGPGAKSIEDVELQVAGSGAWQPVTAGERLVMTGSGNTNVEVAFRVAVDYDDAPGTYVAPLTFRVARR